MITNVEVLQPNKLVVTFTRPERPEPDPLDKEPRYKCTMRFDAGRDDWGQHEMMVSMDQYMRMLAITREQCC